MNKTSLIKLLLIRYLKTRQKWKLKQTPVFQTLLILQSHKNNSTSTKNQYLSDKKKFKRVLWMIYYTVDKNYNKL